MSKNEFKSLKKKHWSESNTDDKDFLDQFFAPIHLKNKIKINVFHQYNEFHVSPVIGSKANNK